MSLEKAKNVAETVNKLVETGTATFEEFRGLKSQVNEGVDKVKHIVELELKQKVQSAINTKKMKDFLGEFNPLVKAFTGLSSVIKGGKYDPQSIEHIINVKLFGDGKLALLENPASSTVLLHMEQQNPGFLFNMMMEPTAPLKSIEDIPLNTEIKVRSKNWTTLVSFLDQSATIPQILPDPTITGIKVTPRNGAAAQEYKRELEGTQFVFKSTKDKSVLKLEDVASFVVTAKGGDRDRARLWKAQRSQDINTTISTKLDGDLPRDRYVDPYPEEGEKVRKLYRAMPEPEKLSPKGILDAGCYRTAENLARHLDTKFVLGTAKTYKGIVNKANDASFNMITYIPKLIAESQKSENPIKPGTVFWIKKDASIHDPKSVNPAAGNHFFTYVGTIKTPAGKEEPYFVDQFGFGNLARMNFSYPIRYFHQAFAPPASA